MLAAFGLAACGGGGGGTASTTPTPPPTMPDGGPVVPPSALERAFELDGQFADVDVMQSLDDAIENVGKLTSADVNGDSAMAAANAQAVLNADAAIRQAAKDAAAVIEEATEAKEAAEAIEDAAEKAAVMRLLDDAIDKATAVKEAADLIIANTTTSGTETIDTLGEAVAAVRGPDEDMPNDAADAGEAVAEAVKTALEGTIGTGALNDAPDDAVRNDSSKIGAMTWEQIMSGMNIEVMTVRRLVSGSVTEVKAASVDGRKVSDFATASASPPDNDSTSTDGTAFDALRRGHDGMVFCGGADCKVDAAGNMTGSWYFTPDDVDEIYVADPAEAGSYMVATMYARYGYWVNDNGSVSTIAVVGDTDTNTVNLDLTRATEATADVTATYTGDAVGIAVRDKASGQFTADVSLTATFGETAGKLGGHISNFAGGVANPDWRVMLEETELTEAAALVGGNGVAYGGAMAGRWTAQGYGPPRENGPDDIANNDDDVTHRPTGFFGRFNANFQDGGAAAGAYTTRVD